MQQYYSSLGEDYVLSALFVTGWIAPKLLNGFYIDIGAHHPINHSNTAYFYNLGWRGINIEASPGAFTAFERERPRDINLNYAVSSTDGEIDFHLFGNKDSESFGQASTINSAHREYIEAEQRVNANTITVKSMRLDTILDQHCGNRDIDFMDIDVEGAELDVLESNSFSKYRPLVIAIEILTHGESVEEVLCNNSAVRFLKENGYRFFSLTLQTYFFYDAHSIRKDIITRWGIS